MKHIDKNIIRRIELLAEELPQKQKQELLDLTTGWRKNTRQTKREPYTELVKFDSEHGVHYGHVKDINTGGCFIECRGIFQPGEQVKFVLTFISSPNPVRLSGTVVRTTAKGIGVRFDEACLKRVRDLELIIARHAQIIGKATPSS